MPRKLQPEMSVRLVANDFPPTRDVFRSYGEETERPVFGHLESLAHFARRRRIPLDRLLDEVAGAAGLEMDRNASADQRLHRPFIATALLVTLSLGALWGAYLLLKIGWSGTFSVIPAAYVVAHGNAQLWGFVAVFIVGIALRYLGGATSRPAPRRAVRRLLLAALIASAVADFAWSVAPQTLPWLGVTRGVALLIAAAVYWIVVFRFVRAQLDQVWAESVLAAAGWFVLGACWTLWLGIRAGGEGPGSFTQTDRQVVMDLALFGLAMTSVYGFGRKLLPGLMGIGKPGRGMVEAAFWLHNVGLAVLLAGHAGHTAPLVIAGLCAIALGALAFVAGLRGLRVAVASGRSAIGHPLLRRYMQLALVWLLISLTGFAVVAALQSARGMVVPHAVTGALRHAFTVGFVVTLILGVAQRLIPVLEHTPLAMPRLVAPTFYLIATGNLVRVASELAAAWSTSAFRVMPLSALLELGALTLFSVNIVRTIWPAPDPLLRTGRVTLDSRAAVLFEEHPWIEDELIAWGLDYVRRARQVPAELTIGTMASSNGFEAAETVARINALLRARHS
jgi:hypothetical protein